MLITVKTALVQRPKNACLIIGICQDSPLSDSAKEIDQICKGAITKLIKQGKFKGQAKTLLPLYHLQNLENDSVLLVGCGKKDSLTPMSYKRLAQNAFRNINPADTAVVCYLADLNVKGKSTDWKVRQLAEAAQESFYRFDLFKSDKQPKSALKDLIIHVNDAKEAKHCQAALAQAKAIAEGVTFAKNLGNLPSNICTPSFLAEQAKALAKDYAKLSVKVLQEKDMQKLGMGALLAVSQGSAEDAKLICLEYKGGKKEAPVALVGKGITFDTGGNSLKSPDSMVGMKYDMCGAATVLGTMKAAAELKLPINLVGIIPAVENMPGGTAYKPEDILTSMSGQTIEVISTDAEGRLILADALTYCERYKPAVVIDIATLTGAVVIALGFHATGLLSNDEKLTEDLLEAGEESNDRAWPLPMWDEFQEQINSPFADMANTGGRPGGTITAACFLSRFAKKFKWAHLDVAGTAAMMMGTSDRMATGRPIPMLMQYLINRSE